MTTVHIVDAFTRTPDTGNRAGVVLDADSLSVEQMQKIAAYAGYSETAFVHKPDAPDHDAYVRYFTPSSEVPICGHATIATHFLRASLLGLEQYPLRAKTGVGILPVSIEQSGTDTLVSMQQGSVEFGKSFSTNQRIRLAEALGIAESDFVENLPIQIVSTGHSKVMVPMHSRTLMNGLAPSGEKLSAMSREVQCNGFFTFTVEGSKSSPETHGRMFAPAIGIYEDPVTGNANGPLGAYLTHYKLVDFEQTLTFKAHQGHAMGKPGTVYVSVDRRGGINISIAGEAVIAGSFEFDAE